MRPQDKVLLNTIKAIDGPLVYQPDRTTLKISEQGSIPFPSTLSEDARKANVLPGLKNASLLSIGKLCDDNCIALFTKQNLLIYKNGNIIIQGYRCNKDGLWNVPFPKTKLLKDDKIKPELLNYIIQKDQSKVELATYLHACLGSPTVSTLTAAIRNGNLTTFPQIDT